MGALIVNDPANLENQAEAEDLDIINNLVVNKEQRFPDISYGKAVGRGRSGRG